MGSEQFEGFVRVSTVLDYFAEPGLVDWMVKKGADAKKLAKHAMKIGTAVDQAIKEFVLTGVYGKLKTIEAISGLDGFKRWHDDYKPSLSVGKRLFSDSHHLTGEPDLYWGDRIIDIKVAREIRGKYHLQTGAYALMDSKNATGILRLHKQLGDYEYVVRDGEAVKADGYCFLWLYDAYCHLESLQGKKESYADYVADTGI